MLLFGRDAFLTIDGQRTFHDMSRETGKVWEERVTKDLSKLVFKDLFPQLVTAIANCDKDRPAEIGRRYLDDVRQSALILLYRLLFVVYAEDRDLLPKNKEPYKDYSLTAMRLEIAGRKAQGKVFSSSSAFYWTKLKTIFKAIASGDNDFGIPPTTGVCLPLRTPLSSTKSISRHRHHRNHLRTVPSRGGRRIPLHQLPRPHRPAARHGVRTHPRIRSQGR